METSDRSPIIERLCKFIAYSGLTNSQFADKAAIPRPSLSQMLHGRNKSLNNQVLEKLNDAFPELNISWLLFGQGDMLTVSNIKFSERQNSAKNDISSLQNTENQCVDNGATTNNSQPNLFQSVSNQPQNPENSVFPDDSVQNRTVDPNSPLASSVNPAFADIISRAVSNQENSKKIASIIVLYTDNSFETYLPSKDC